MSFRPKQILINSKAADSAMAAHVLAAHPQAEVVSIPANTHAWNGRAHSLAPEDHWREKREKLAVLHRTARWRPDPNGRSTDFLPSVKLGTGCAFFCQYCYVERRTPNAFVKVFDDALSMVDMVAETMDDLERWRERLLQVQGADLERERDPQHPPYVSFDLGCDTDVTIDNQATRHAGYPGHMVEIMNRIAEVPGAMTSFATKGVELEPFLADCRHPERHRVRLSLLPEHQRRVLELNTAPVAARLEAVNRLVAAGFEAHINLSPIVVTDDFEAEYEALLRQIDDALTSEAKRQLAYEVIFLTHSETLYEPVAARRPQAHALLTGGPLPLATKPHKPGVLTYPLRDKAPLKRWLREATARITPYARIRYMF